MVRFSRRTQSGHQHCKIHKNRTEKIKDMIKFIKKHKKFVIVYWIVMIVLYLTTIGNDLIFNSDLVLYGMSVIDRTIAASISSVLLFILLMIAFKYPKLFGL